MSYNVSFGFGMGTSNPYGSLLESETDIGWRDDAACAFQPYTLFEIATDDSPISRGLNRAEIKDLNLANFTRAAEICATCPVLAECKADMNWEDRDYSFRAGLVPLKFSGTHVGRPQKLSCEKKGHGALSVEPSGRRICKPCRSEYEKSRRSRRINDPAKATCVRGHVGKYRPRSKKDVSMVCGQCVKDDNRARRERDLQEGKCYRGHSGASMDPETGRVSCEKCATYYRDRARAKAAKMAE